MVPTAEICPWVDRKKLITDDKAVPNITKITTSSSSSNTSATVIYQPITAIYTRHTAAATKQISKVAIRVAA